jgi:hypothetical protein
MHALTLSGGGRNHGREQRVCGEASYIQAKAGIQVLCFTFLAKGRTMMTMVLDVETVQLSVS